MTLTEQWKKGELTEGYYYIRNKAHSVKFDEIDYYMVYGENRYWHGCEVEDIEEVLAPVPSYEEWKSTGEFAMEAMKVAEENQQLKELLQECRKVLNKAKGDTVWYPVEIDHILTQIDEMLK